jgi:tetratricopeptide (TPR) repeat protein
MELLKKLFSLMPIKFRWPINLIYCFPWCKNYVAKTYLDKGKELLFNSGHQVSKIVNAQFHFERAARLLPHNALVYVYLAWSLDNQGKWTEAKMYYEMALKLDPELEIARTRYAIALEELGIEGQPEEFKNPQIGRAHV